LADALYMFSKFYANVQVGQEFFFSQRFGQFNQYGIVTNHKGAAFFLIKKINDYGIKDFESEFFVLAKNLILAVKKIAFYINIFFHIIYSEQIINYLDLGSLF